MDKQLMISLGREFGSGGHVIAEKLADNYGIALYDKNILQDIAEEKLVSEKTLRQYDERPRNPLLSRTVRGFTNSPEENIARMQFDFIRERADAGESFVIVGRCAESVLRGRSHLITIFVMGDMDQKVLRTMATEKLSEAEAAKRVEQVTRQRKAYHNHYCKEKWGDARNYDLTINSSRLGIEGTTCVLMDYIDARRTADNWE
ncbi:AAA family ATPase [uncultured Pseudoramibacter sp.]|uniref:cytidylate kinase-like family protein n=1 Tax=uncultured Pseudoramibacter sp. TaxID=1623493 RepID=UPI0025DE0DD0|nr:cytidylate kinase-like family protein [uncultured Pseudoramibacter sp.]